MYLVGSSGKMVNMNKKDASFPFLGSLSHRSLEVVICLQNISAKVFVL